MIRHCISEGWLPNAAVDVLQLRAKQLGTGELLERARKMRAAFPGTLLINDRIDVCLAAGADGVHLPSGRIAPMRIKQRFGPLIVGVSCHTEEELLRAEQEGADFAYLSPVFPKPGYGPALGLDRFAEMVQKVRLPVLALGGVTPENVADCITVGAAGIAGIGLFKP